MRPLTTTDAAQVEAALRACRETGVSPAVTAKVSEHASTVRYVSGERVSIQATRCAARHTLAHACGSLGSRPPQAEATLQKAAKKELEKARQLVTVW